VQAADTGADLIYIDLHLLHEANTAQAFAELRAASRTVRRPELTLGTEDHMTPTGTSALPRLEPTDERLTHIRRNCRDFGIELFQLGDAGRGITHVIGPETGLSQPGMTIICCDSHTTTHGAFGALAFGVGTSQVEHVLATQTLRMRRMKNMRITVDGVLAPGVTAKDLALAVIERIGTAGGQGHVIEYDGPAVRALSMEGRMTLCNMSIEAGARAALVTPDEVTFAYLRERKYVPAGADFDREVDYWSSFVSDPDAAFDKEVRLDATVLSPRVSWGTNPAQSVPLDGVVPAPAEFADADERRSAEQALA
jgi:3-isopropylmalate/(R)-2-methylmalate dehydratase large subunit